MMPVELVVVQPIKCTRRVLVIQLAVLVKASVSLTLLVQHHHQSVLGRMMPVALPALLLTDIKHVDQLDVLVIVADNQQALLTVSLTLLVQHHHQSVLGRMMPVALLVLLIKGIKLVDQLDVLVTVMENQQVILSVLLILLVFLPVAVFATGAQLS
jgi:hypothetical protein